MPNPLSDAQEKEIFRLLVDTQDSGVTVSESRTRLATQFDIELVDVVRIERAGIKANWPPLDVTFLATEFDGQSESEGSAQ